MTKQALRELRDAVQASPAAAAFLLSVLSTAPEAVVRKPLAEMLQLASSEYALTFDSEWLEGSITKRDLAAALAVLLGAAAMPSAAGWTTLAPDGGEQSSGRLVTR